MLSTANREDRDLKAKQVAISFENILEGIEKFPAAKEDQILGLKTKMLKITTSDFASLLTDQGEAWGFDEVRTKEACLYIGLSTQGYGETAMALGRIFLSDLLFQSYSTLISSSDSHVSIGRPLSVYFDEIGSLITPQFIELQNKCRGAGIRLSFACQSTADIDRVDPHLTKQVIENAANLFIFKQRVEDSVKFLSESIGTVPSTKKTYQTDDEKKSGVGSLREVNGLIVHPDLIKNLRVGQCILVRHGPTQVDLLNLRARRGQLKNGKSVANFLSGIKGATQCKRAISMIQRCKKFLHLSGSGPSSPCESSQSLTEILE